MPAHKVCPQCSATYPVTVQFCQEDGTPLSAPRGDREEEVINDRYILKNCLGKGGMGVVYRASHKVLERSFAIKLLQQQGSRDQAARDRFQREARACCIAEHPNIVKIYDFGHTQQGEPYIVMEFLEGSNLYDYLQQCEGGRLGPEEAIDIALPTARAMQHAHQRGVVHRDIKLENIFLVDGRDPPDHVKIVDFGVARIADIPFTNYQQGERPGGTALYAAPELTAPRPTEAPVDLYAFGIVLFEMLTSKPPFTGPWHALMLAHERTIPPLLTDVLPRGTVPNELAWLVAKLLSKKPEDRPSSQEAIARLEEIRAQLRPQSLRSLMLARTVLLPDRPAMTVLLKDMRKIDAVEAEIRKLQDQLLRHFKELAPRRWPGPWPLAAQANWQLHCADEEREHQRGLDLALLEDQHREAKERLLQERDWVHQRVVELSLALQREDLPQVERAAKQRQLLEQERQVLKLDRSYLADIPAALQQTRQSLQDLRTGQQEVLANLARLLVAPGAPAELAKPLREVADLLHRYDATLEARVNLLRSLGAKAPQ